MGPAATRLSLCMLSLLPYDFQIFRLGFSSPHHHFECSLICTNLRMSEGISSRLDRGLSKFLKVHHI